MDPRSSDDEPPVEAVEEGLPTFTKETPQVERNATTIEGWRHSVGTPRGIWPIGRVMEEHPRRDGTTRVVTVRTACGTLSRPATALVKVF